MGHVLAWYGWRQSSAGREDEVQDVTWICSFDGAMHSGSHSAVGLVL
ncbi:unnamed protein product [Linum tenue]|uniref:Uncharacterized protein n=1 Tax=Linum tenue TaxID=586396 RepID=A0AAV0JTX1_9ROSI|nr:unnamed protein product [Linum tenue]